MTRPESISRGHTLGAVWANARLLSAKIPEVMHRHPNARVVRNDVGNLAIYDPDGFYLGYIDLYNGEVETEE